MGMKIEDVPDNPNGTRLCYYEGDFCLLTLDLPERLPMSHWHQAERILLHYFGEWLLDPKSSFHSQWPEMAKAIKQDPIWQHR